MTNAQEGVSLPIHDVWEGYTNKQILLDFEITNHVE
jgi:hypothetical protein